MIGAKLIEAAGNGISTVAVAEAIDFDGTNDYLSRSSDLVGNADGKTFTFSAWVWLDGGDTAIYSSDPSGGGANFNVLYVSSILQVRGYNTSGSSVCSFDVTGLPRRTFVNILISIDLTNATKYIYINDISTTPSTPSYTNANIDFTSTTQRVGRRANDYSADGRLSNVFLDYTYRDLSIEANRRLFVTADLKPAADQAALNPILYLPLDDPTNPGFNAGTGGNFTLTGTVARSGRGPNQYNAPYSQLNGSADYLSRTTAPTGIADGKTFTFQCVLSSEQTGANYDVVSFSSSTTYKFRLYIVSSAYFRLTAYNASNTEILDIEFGSVTANRNYVITVSVDLSNTSNRRVYVNGSVPTVLFWNTYTNDNIDFGITSTPRYNIGATSANAASFPGKLGALWFNTSYIDLSQPANLAKFVTGTGIDAKPVDLGANGELPTGTSPLIYLPMYGNNAGKNYGTGGDFSVNSGPYTGARGPNEYWGNKADFDGTTGYLSRTSALSGVSNGKVVSGSFWINGDVVTGSPIIFDYGTSAPTSIGKIDLGSSQLRFFLYDLGTTRMSLTATTTTIGAGTGYFVQYCFDLSDTANRYVFINGVQQTLAVTTYVNATIPFSSINLARIGVSAYSPPNNIFNGKLSEFYFTTDYIDFSQEANRLKFRDAFGNPVDLTQQIEDAAIPNPAIYMRFPPTAFGTNYGTGGDFTVNGTITDGGQL